MKLIHNSASMFDIVCLQNTRMNRDEHKYGNYTWHTSGSSESTSYGVAILVSNQNRDLKMSKITKLSECMCSANFIYKGKEFKIVCCYLPPSGNAWCSSVKSTIATQLNESKVFTILLGDFNAEIGTSDLGPEDLPRMGVNTVYKKSNENGLYLTSLSKSNNLRLASSLESSRTIPKYHVFINSDNNFECKVFCMKNAQSHVFANNILKFALKPKTGSDLHQTEPALVSSTNEKTRENLWQTQESNDGKPQISLEGKSSEAKKSNDFLTNPLKRTLQETPMNPFQKFQPKISKMDPTATSSVQNSQTKQLFADKTTNKAIQQPNMQPRPISQVPAPNVENKQEPLAEKTVKTNLAETQKNLESHSIHNVPATEVEDKSKGMDPRFGVKLTVWVNNRKCSLRVVPKTLDSFYSSIGQQLYPYVNSESGVESLSRVLQQRTINYIRRKKDSFFTDVCKLYNRLFPNHGYDPDFTFEHGCLYLLGKSRCGSGERIAAQAIASIFTVPIIILEVLKCEKDYGNLTVGPPTEILPESGKSLHNYGTIILIIKQKPPGNHYDILNSLTESTSEFLRSLGQTSSNSRRR